jgi:hypothetical protein
VTALTEQESHWVSEVAGRLRLIQVGAPGSSREQRREYFQEEVARQLKGVPAGNRKRYLEALLERFPVAGHVVTIATTPVAPIAAAAAAPPPPEPRPETPDELLTRFLAEAAKSTDSQRAEFSRRLAEAGFAQVDRDSLVLEVSDKLREGLGLEVGQQPSLTRLVELAVFLVDALYQLDQQALKTMEKLAPRSPMIKRDPRDFRRVAARFLVSEGGDLLEPQWRLVRGLLGALLAAIQGGGRDFGRQYVVQMSPGAIEEIVRADSGSARFPWSNIKERFWEKFKELSEKEYPTADAVDRKIKDSLAAFAEKAVGARPGN